MRNTTAKFYEYIGSVSRYSIHTKQSYQADLDSFASFLAITYQIVSIDEVTHFHIRSWIVSMVEASYSTRSINRKISALNTFYKFCRRFGIVTADPMAKVVRPKQSKRLPTFVPEKQLVGLSSAEYDGVDEDYMAQLSYMVILTLYTTGLRRAELISLRDTDIDRQRMVISVMGKGRKQRLIPINAQWLKKVENFQALRNKLIGKSEDFNLFLTSQGKPLYPKMVYNIVHKFLNSIPDLEKRSPHILRHSFATHLSDGGADINAIKMLLGHASLAATQVYMHNAPNRLKTIYTQAHPRSTSDK